jgi:hypothetical protein
MTHTKLFFNLLAAIATCTILLITLVSEALAEGNISFNRDVRSSCALRTEHESHSRNRA